MNLFNNVYQEFISFCNISDVYNKDTISKMFQELLVIILQ